jgi:predicted RNase H-like HicB family nuclease
MNRPQNVTVHTWQEGKWWVAQCLEVDVATQGRTEQDALDNIKGALDLFFEEPVPTIIPQVHTVNLAVA